MFDFDAPVARFVPATTGNKAGTRPESVFNYINVMFTALVYMKSENRSICRVFREIHTRRDPARGYRWLGFDRDCWFRRGAAFLTSRKDEFLAFGMVAL